MLTLKEVWKIMSELWEWCAENPDKDKDDWPGWADYGVMWSECPCCEYVISNFGKVIEGITHEMCIEHCPALEMWANGCEHEPSPFLDWDRSWSEAKREAAAFKIADFAKKKYKEVSE